MFFFCCASDIITIRRQFRIPGTLTGVNGTAPLLLTKYEVRLLLELDAITVVQTGDRSDPAAVTAATDRFNAHQKEAFETFAHLVHEEKLSHIRENESAIVSKYRERNDVASLTDEEIIKEKESGIDPVPFHSMPVQLFTASPFHEFKTQVIVKAADIVMSRNEEIKFQAFRQLWRSGFHLTHGTKFACDFLVYENDPAVCHAKYMLFCRETEAEISALEILLKGRLSVQVGKQPVFAVVQMPPADSSDSVHITFMKLVWEGKRFNPVQQMKQFVCK